MSGHDSRLQKARRRWSRCIPCGHTTGKQKCLLATLRQQVGLLRTLASAKGIKREAGVNLASAERTKKGYGVNLA